MKMVKQKFTIKLEYPEADTKVTAKELYGIIGTGLKCFGWNIKVQEEDIPQPIYENRYNNTLCNNELQKLLKQFPGNAMVAVEYCDVKKLQYFPDRNLIAID